MISSQSNIPGQRIPPPSGKRKKFPLWILIPIGLFGLFIGSTVFDVIKAFQHVDKAREMVQADNIEIVSHSIVQRDSLYEYIFLINNGSDEEFSGRIDMAFERKTLPYGFNQSIHIKNYVSPAESQHFSFLIAKPPQSIDPEDGLHRFRWGAFRDSGKIEVGEGILVNEVSELPQ